MDNDAIKRDVTNLPEADLKMAADSLREMTGANDPTSERDEKMNGEERGGPHVDSILPVEMGAPSKTEQHDETWEREAYPTPIRPAKTPDP